MDISFNTGTTASADTAASVDVTIPSGVLVNDVMIMSLEVFTEDSSAPTVSFSGAGGTWTLVPVSAGSNPETCNSSGVYSYGYAYYRVATSGDPGATLTVSESGSAAGTTWMDVALVSYTGASTSSPIDVAAGAGIYSGSGITCPSKTTGVANDWAVYLWNGAPGGSPGITGPAGTTQRQNIVDAANVGAGIWDSDGSVGAAGTAIGGGTFTGGSSDWWQAFTIGLAPPGSPPPLPSGLLMASFP